MAAVQVNLVQLRERERKHRDQQVGRDLLPQVLKALAAAVEREQSVLPGRQLPEAQVARVLPQASQVRQIITVAVVAVVVGLVQPERVALVAVGLATALQPAQMGPRILVVALVAAVLIPALGVVTAALVAAE